MESHFPFIKPLRDAVGHSADMRFRDADIWKHAADGNSISGTLFNNTYISDRGGKRTKFELSDGSLDALVEIRDKVFASFSKKVR